MKKTLKTLFFIFAIVLLTYLSIPNEPFPRSSDKSMRSTEPADVESDLRRGYYNDETRSDVIAYYKKQFDSVSFLGIELNLPSFTLNYPPEDAQILIRDQTRSTYLEEIVHPMRESIFINGFEPKKNSDAIIVGDRVYKQKIIIKMINSRFLIRITAGIFALLSIFLLYKFWLKSISELLKAGKLLFKYEK